jgi:pimeloyl-ACP methyl ester carboxylesterase
LGRRARSALALGLPLAVLCACGAPARPRTGEGPGFHPCQLSTPGTALRQAARCTTVTVPEGGATDRTIDLNVAVLPALNRRPRPDPLVFIAGGPGQAATESYPILQGAFGAVQRDRDVILVDQRGTGGSHPLRCPTPPLADSLAASTPEETTRRTRDCAIQLARDADLTRYGTIQAVDDLEAVRTALGLGPVNLYGVSYGSRVALEYLRRHPDAVRSAVLDGVVPPDEPLGRDLAPDAQRVLDELARRCAADAGCGAAFPAFPGELAALGERLATAPATLSLPHPVSGAPLELTFGRQALNQTVRLLLYAPETAALLPLLVHRAAADGELGRLAAEAILAAEPLEDSLAEGMGHSVICAEDLPELDLAAASTASRETFLGDESLQLIAAACAGWPAAELPDDFHAPVDSDVPVLVLSGEVDPVTPPENGARVAEHLPNSRHIVAPGQGHGVVARGCLPRLVADFLAKASAAELDADCVDELASEPFFLDPSGGAP